MEKYAKDNNIKSYLKYDKDIYKYVNIQDFEYKKLYNENIETIDDYIFYEIENYNYNLAIENEDIMYLLKYIYGCEFDIEINKNGKINLIDLQGVYLGGAESYENFDTIQDALDRLNGSFLYDYFGIEWGL